VELETTYSAEEIGRIIDQALVYQCACPAQVATTLLELRDLHDYQLKCEDTDDTNRRVHAQIAAAAAEAHARLERCLDEVLELEGWDRATLTMPASLRKRATKSL
jgi:hypothetical protein